MKVGIIGVSSAGKSALFQLLTGSPAPATAGRPEPRLGVARVPDERVDALAELYRPRKKTPATVEYVDVPGVAKGEGAALVDLPALRGVDALVHVCRHRRRRQARRGRVLREVRVHPSRHGRRSV